MISMNRTLIVQGDRDPLHPVEISVEMAKDGTFHSANGHL
jgi:hypothetical protein